MNTFENQRMAMSTSVEQHYINQLAQQQHTSQSNSSIEYQRCNRHSVSSSRPNKGKQSVSKRQSLPTTIQERVAHGERYKTEMCKQFQIYNSCRYDNKCQYAHGANELRSIDRHPKYKTDECRTYHTTGFCPYGARCHFVHDQDPSKPPQQSNKKRIVSTSTIHEEQATAAESTMEQQISLLLTQQQQQYQRQPSLEQIQLQMLQQFQQHKMQEQQIEMERLLRSNCAMWQPVYNLPTYSSSTGSRSPLNSDSERSSPSIHQAPLYTLFYPGQDQTVSTSMPPHQYFPSMVNAAQQ